MKIANPETVKLLREKYPSGTRIKVVEIDDRNAPGKGSLGTVEMVDDIGLIHVDWDNASKSAISWIDDKFKIIKEKHT